MGRTKRAFDDSLPGASCFSELRKEFEEYAKRTGKSRGDVIREMAEFFLQNERRKSDVKYAENESGGDGKEGDQSDAGGSPGGADGGEAGGAARGA